MLKGASNKVGFVLAFLSACCWVVYVVGLALEYQSLLQPQLNSNSSTVTDELLSVPYLAYWMYAVSSAPFYVTALIQFLCGNLLFSVTLMLLAPLVLVSMGGMLQSNGLLYYHYYLLKDSAHDPPSDYVHVQVAGALGALLCVWVALCLWVCGVHQGSRTRSRDYEQIN